jgi:hypothetical protein
LWNVTLFSPFESRTSVLVENVASIFGAKSVLATCFYAGLLLGIFFYPAENVGWLLTD